MWLASAVLTVAVIVAYHNSFAVPFIFDDIPAIVENPAVQHPSIGAWLGSKQTGGLTTSGRPVVALSLAFNHALGGNVVWGYHATNLAIHMAAGLCLLGIVRRTLLLPSVPRRFAAAALPLAFLVAGLWTLHPLQTESVTYVVQRAESLAGLFCLLTLYAFVRSIDSPGTAAWRSIAIVACLLGMASKESVVAAPVIVLLYDRAFVSGSFGAAWQRRGGFHLALFATWALLAILVIGTGSRGGTAGFDTALSSWTYALTQCRGIARYAWLAVWPAQLVFDYGLATARSVIDVLPQAIALLTVVAWVAVSGCRRTVGGFLGCSFFALLAPSSSVVPVATQTIAEHRLYLPLAGVSVALVVGAFALVGRRAFVVGGGAMLALIVATLARNHDYRSEAAIWSDTASKLPTNARAHNNLGQALFRAGKTAEAMARYERALELQPNYPETHYNLGVALVSLGRTAEGIDHYEAALRLQPAYPEAHNNLGNALVKMKREPEAIRHYEEAIAEKPGFAEAHNNFGNALLQSGQASEATSKFQRAIELKPDYAEAHYNLGNAHAAAGAMREALEEYERALKLKSDYTEAHVNAGNALLALGRTTEALPHYEQAIALKPDLADAHYNLAAALMELERWADAIPRFEATLRLNPAFARAQRGLGFALAKVGRPGEALAHYENYLRAVPDDAEAREELKDVRAQAGRR